MSEVKLIVRGLEYSGWTSVQLDFSMKNLSQSFSFTASEKYPNHPEKFDIACGDSCTIKYGDKTIMVGWIEDVCPEYDSNGHNIKISGRDLMCDVVDSCRDVPANEAPKKQFLNTKIKNIVSELLRPHSIGLNIDAVVASASEYVIPRFMASEGETLNDLISKVCKTKAILPLSYGLGKLTLTRSGYGAKATDRIKLGYNVLSGTYTQSNKERFTKYIVKGHGLGLEEMDMGSITNPHGSQDDLIMKGKVAPYRYRPLTIVAETLVTNKQCSDRAKWEASVRAGNSRKLDYTVQGWTQHDGTMWTINSLVKVEDSTFGVEDVLLIDGLSFSLSDQGTMTNISVVDKRTYDLVDEPISNIGMSVQDDIKEISQ